MLTFFFLQSSFLKRTFTTEYILFGNVNYFYAKREIKQYNWHNLKLATKISQMFLIE